MEIKTGLSPFEKKLKAVFDPSPENNRALYRLMQEYPHIDVSIIKEAAKAYDNNPISVLSNVEITFSDNLKNSVLAEMLGKLYSDCNYLICGKRVNESGEIESVVQLTLKEADKIFSLDEKLNERTSDYLISYNKEILPGKYVNLVEVFEEGELDLSLLENRIDNLKIRTKVR